MVTKGGSDVPADQSDPVFAVAEGAGMDRFLVCMLSIPYPKAWMAFPVGTEIKSFVSDCHQSKEPARTDSSKSTSWYPAQSLATTGTREGG